MNYPKTVTYNSHFLSSTVLIKKDPADP